MSATRRAVALALGAALAAGACGSDDQPASPTGAAAGSPGAGAPHATPASEPGAPGADGSPNPGGTGEFKPTPGAGFGDIPAIVAEVQPSVVSIQRDRGEGSGVFWSADGVVVTNHHVVQGVDEVVVVLADGTREPGTVIASDPRSDLAIVQVERDEPGNFPAAEFATDLPRVGSLAIAIGNPLGFENTVTAGIVSGQHRAVPGAAQGAPALVDLIQTDAAISPGNSGGALVGGDGRVIGINVAYIPPQAGSVSIGFAIPASTVRDVVGQLLEDGIAEHPWLGVEPVQLTPQIAQQFGLSRDTGALVVDVVPGSPAAAAGIEPGDVLVGVGDDRVETVEDLLGALRRHDVGASVAIRLNRGGEEQEVRVTLGAFPDVP
jgi:S1-C subfamily serine protease